MKRIQLESHTNTEKHFSVMVRQAGGKASDLGSIPGQVSKFLWILLLKLSNWTFRLIRIIKKELDVYDTDYQTKTMTELNLEDFLIFCPTGPC